jgi:hypothetical protein
LKLRKIEPSELGKYAQQVTGTDENGNNVHGNINIEGKLVLVPLLRKMLKILKLSWNGTEQTDWPRMQKVINTI